jgi:hypothetical protein
MSDTGDIPDFVEPPPTNNNKEADEKQSSKTKKSKKSAKIAAPESATPNTVEDIVVEVPTKRKDKEVEPEIQQPTKKSSPPPLVTTSSSEDPAQILNRTSKRKKENVILETLIITTEKVAKAPASAPVQQQRNCTELDTLKEVNNLPSSLKSLSPTSLTSPKRPVKREEGWKEVVRRGPVSSRENSSSNLGSTAAGGKKSQSSDRSSGTLSVIQSSERSKKVTVPSNAISRVIGRAGCNINAIREISGAHIEIEKQGKGQGDRTVLIKGLAESIRQAQQLISALIKEPEKEFNELMAKFRAANAAAKAGASATSAGVKPGTAATTSVAASQPKVTRAATTIASSKPTTTAPVSGQPAPVPSTVAWGAINTLIVAASSPKRTVPASGSKTPPVTAGPLFVQQPQQQLLAQQQKSGAVRQLFPEVNPAIAVPVAKKVVSQTSTAPASAAVVKPVVSYSVAGNATVVPTTSGAASTRTTPVVSGQFPAPTKVSPQQVAPQAPSKPSDKTSPLMPASSVTSHQQQVPTQQQQQPATSQAQHGPVCSSQAQQMPSSCSVSISTSNSLVSSRPSSASPVQDYSPFNNLFSKVAQQSMWYKEQQQGSKSSSKNFASVAASGVSPIPSKSTPTSLASSLSGHQGDSGPSLHVVDAAKAPGYRGNLTATSQSQNDMSTMDLPTSLASSAPGTPIPSSCAAMRAPVGSRHHPLTPPPRMGTPPLFNPTPIQPLGPVGARNMQSNQTSGGPPDSIMMPPPPAASLAPGGPSATVRMRPNSTANRMQHEPPQQQQQPQYDGMPMTNFYGISRPSGPMGGGGGDSMRQAPSFPLAPGMGGPPRYNNTSLSTSFSASAKLNPNAPDFATSRGGGGGGPQQQGYPVPMFGGGNRISFPPAGYGLGSANGGDMKQHQHMPNQNFGTDYPPPIGTPFGSSANELHRMMGYPGPGVANRMSGPPPSTQTSGGLLGNYNCNKYLI